MKSLAKALLVMGVLVPSAVLAGAPLQGAWSSTDLGGPVPTGRYTEGWAAGGGAMLAGTTLNAASWDGATLGGSWSYTCAAEAANAVLIDDTVNAQGFGARTWRKTFSGGTIWLSGTGPWSSGDPQYTGPIVSYVEYETLTYAAFVVVGARTNVSAQAMIEAYPQICLGFTVGNGTKISDTALPNYPAPLTTGCSPTAPNGAYWGFTQLTLYIAGCEVDAQQQSWSAMKAQYK